MTYSLNLSKAQKRLFKNSFKDFRRFMISEGIWWKFRHQIFKYYGWISIENMFADNNVMPPEYLNMPILIYCDKSTDWGIYSIRWQSYYYQTEDKL